MKQDDTTLIAAQIMAYDHTQPERGDKHPVLAMFPYGLSETAPETFGNGIVLAMRQFFIHNEWADKKNVAINIMFEYGATAADIAAAIGEVKH